MAKAPKYTKLEIIEIAQRLARESDGQAPGFDALRKAGVHPYHWEMYWDRITELQIAAGLESNSFDQSYSKEKLLAHLAELTRRNQAFPVEAQLSRESRLGKGVPGPDVLRKRLGGKAEQIASLREWISERPDWSDIIPLIPTAAPARTRSKAVTEISSVTDVTLSDGYLPPVIASLPGLGSCAPGITRQAKLLGLDPDIEFEKRVAIALWMLGLKVEPLGQGKGRNPDGIAMCLPGHWALVYDAKARGEGFRLTAAEDRKAEEYLRVADPRLRAAGVQSVYFVYISSDFVPADLVKASELVARTAAKSVVFLCTDALLELVTLRLREPDRFDLERLHRVFRLTDIVRARSVER